MGFLLFLIIAIVLIVVIVKSNSASKRCPFYRGRCNGVNEVLLEEHGLSNTVSEKIRFESVMCEGKGASRQWKNCSYYSLHAMMNTPTN